MTIVWKVYIFRARNSRGPMDCPKWPPIFRGRRPKGPPKFSNLLHIFTCSGPLTLVWAPTFQGAGVKSSFEPCILSCRNSKIQCLSHHLEKEFKVNYFQSFYLPRWLKKRVVLCSIFATCTTLSLVKKKWNKRVGRIVAHILWFDFF